VIDTLQPLHTFTMSLIPIINKVLDDEFFGMPSRPLYPPMPLMRSLDSNANATLRHSSPCYEIHEDDTKFQFSIDVPGVKPEDMTVQVEQNGRVLHLAGGRKIKRGDEVIETRFEKSFSLGKNIDASKITANLADGVMVVTAPKDVSKDQVVKIAITQNPHA
jgi:HSP20 family protein